jgi:DNA mismatch repair protein MutS2
MAEYSPVPSAIRQVAQAVYHDKMPPVPIAYSSARVLEFEALRDLLRGYCSSPVGRARVTALEPSADRAWIETQHQLTAEIREFRRVGGHFEFSGVLDVQQMVRKARIEGATLETGEIRDVILVVGRAAEWRQITLSPPATM